MKLTMKQRFEILKKTQPLLPKYYYKKLKPVDIKKIVEGHGFHLLIVDNVNDKLKKYGYESDDVLSSCIIIPKRVIIIDKTLPSARRRWLIAHEFAHFILNHKGNIFRSIK